MNESINTKSTNLRFSPAQLSAGNVWYITYYVEHPDSGVMIRKRIKCNRINPISERKKYAKHLIKDINDKLYAGWNPFIEDIAPKAFLLLSSALNTFLNEKQRELRKDGFRSYKSYVSMLINYLEVHNNINIYCWQFDKRLAMDYLRAAYIDKKISNRTFNNYLAFYRGLFNWLKQNDYCSNNPFATIEKKKKEHKKRIQIIELETRSKIINYWESVNENYKIMCLLAFYCLIRPKELSYMKLTWINLNESIICVPGEISKNGKTRACTIPNVFLPELTAFVNKYSNIDKNTFLFSADFCPGKKWNDSRNTARLWSRMRENLNLDKNLKFYSLRDCGIIQKLRDGISPDIVMYQADHYSIEVTNEYIKVAKPGILKEIKDLSSSFSQ